MPRRVRVLTISPYQEIELQDGEVARVVKVEYVRVGQYVPSASGYSTSTAYQPPWSPPESGHWEVLVVTGPPETADEIATAMRRTLENAP